LLHTAPSPSPQMFGDAHSSISLQLAPSPAQPELQLHVWPPAVLVHAALVSQAPSAAHSSMSTHGDPANPAVQLQE
jgi:hypothetical protein